MYEIPQCQKISKHNWKEVQVKYKYLNCLPCRKTLNIIHKRLDCFNALYLATCWSSNTDAQGRM